MQYIFEWNPVKARLNAQKHDITFELATEVFQDLLAITIYDNSNSYSDEDRWITLGHINNRYYLVVVHTYRDQSDNSATIRIISARNATKHEIQQYEQG